MTLDDFLEYLKRDLIHLEGIADGLGESQDYARRKIHNRINCIRGNIKSYTSGQQYANREEVNDETCSQENWKRDRPD